MATSLHDVDESLREMEALASTRFPAAPTTLDETGLRWEQVVELVVKTIYFAGECTSHEVARTVKLSHSVLEEVFGYLRRERFVEVKSVEGTGRVSFRFQMTDLGRGRAREFLERSQYVGPAPVPLDQYNKWVIRQSVLDVDQEPGFLREGLGHLVISDDLMNALGPAVLSGRSIFLYGPAGNGKTVISEGIAASLGGSLYVPHAIEVDGHVIKVYDPSHHEPLTPDQQRLRSMSGEAQPDPRWILTKRPVVLTGGELTLPMLDLQFNAVARYYEAPFQVKANGGVFVIDDFGRQLVTPHDLLNRWIVPLEKREDYLTLHTGKKFAIPFDSLIVFATNLNPWDLVDEAFLRRIRYKVPVENPTREQYEELFRRMCLARGVEYRPEAVEFVYREYYTPGLQKPRFCHPRDIVDHLCDSVRYFGGSKVLYEKAVANACENYFLQNPFEVSRRGSLDAGREEARQGPRTERNAE